jgi:hypothetical protein
VSDQTYKQYPCVPRETTLAADYVRSRRLNAFHYKSDRDPEGRTLRPRLTEKREVP